MLFTNALVLPCMHCCTAASRSRSSNSLRSVSFTSFAGFGTFPLNTGGHKLKGGLVDEPPGFVPYLTV
eukprot:420578-Pleurochrysis_carterae.AAC.1